MLLRFVVTIVCVVEDPFFLSQRIKRAPVLDVLSKNNTLVEISFVRTEVFVSGSIIELILSDSVLP